MEINTYIYQKTCIYIQIFVVLSDILKREGPQVQGGQDNLNLSGNVVSQRKKLKPKNEL